MKTELSRVYSRRPLYVEAAQVTWGNMEELSTWCKGTIVSTGFGDAYIAVPVKKPENPRRAQAFKGDWILLSTTGFKVYTEASFRGSFELLKEKPCGDPMTTADGMPCVLGEGHRKLEYPIACRSLQDYKEVDLIMSTGIDSHIQDHKEVSALMNEPTTTFVFVTKD